MSNLLKCTHCNSYTLGASCPKCGKKTHNTTPPKYSPKDKYGHYRRMMLENG